MKLPFFLLQKFKCELIRLGKENDGGYAISKKSLKNSKAILGFGLGDDWSFEKDFKKFSDAVVICFDGHVNLRFWFIRFCKDIINFILLKKKSLSDFKRFYTFLNYKLFLNDKKNY